MAAEFQKYKDISPWKDKKSPFFEAKGGRSKQIAVLKKLPRAVFVLIAGFAHAVCYPMLVRLRAEIFGRHKYVVG